MISFFTHLIFSHSSLHTPSHIIFSYLISLYLLSIKQTSEVWSTCFIALAGITTPSYRGDQIHHQMEHHVYAPEYWYFPENLIISNKSLCLRARVLIISQKIQSHPKKANVFHFFVWRTSDKYDCDPSYYSVELTSIWWKRTTIKAIIRVTEIRRPGILTIFYHGKYQEYNIKQIAKEWQAVASNHSWV